MHPLYYQNNQIGYGYPMGEYGGRFLSRYSIKKDVYIVIGAFIAIIAISEFITYLLS